MTGGRSGQYMFRGSESETVSEERQAKYGSQASRHLPLEKAKQMKAGPSRAPTPILLCPIQPNCVAHAARRYLQDLAAG